MSSSRESMSEVNGVKKVMPALLGMPTPPTAGMGGYA